MNQLELNKRTIMNYVEAFNRGDMEKLRALFTSDAVVHGVLGWGALDKVVPIWQQLHDAFAIQLTIDAIVGEGDVLAVRYTERGKSVGPWRGQPATGKSYELVAMEWFEMREGKIARRWGARDSATQARQMELKT